MHKIVWAWGVGWGGLGLMGWGYIDWKEALTSVRCLMLNPSSSNSQPGPACGQLHPFCSSISTFPLFLTEQGSVRVGVLLQRLNWFLLDNKYFSLTHMWHRFTATVTPPPPPPCISFSCAHSWSWGRVAFLIRSVGELIEMHGRPSVVKTSPQRLRGAPPSHSPELHLDRRPLTFKGNKRTNWNDIHPRAWSRRSFFFWWNLALN